MLNKHIRQALKESKNFQTKRSKYLLNNLTEKEKKTSLAKSTLESVQKIFKPTNYESSRMLSFFDGQHIYTYTKNVSNYFNNIMQYNMIDFFNKKRFEIVEEFSIKNGDMVTYSSKAKINYDIGKTFDAYVKATIFWGNKKTKQKFAISIEYNEFEECYTIDIFYCDNTLENILEEWEKFSKANNFYKNKKIDGSCNFLILKESTNWSDVILPDKIRETIRRNVENKLKFKDIIKKNNISVKQGIVISGSPGVGKTVICRILAKALPISVLYVLPSHLDVPNGIQKVCEMAKDLAPTLLILEDIDYIAKDREDFGDNWQSIELMNKLDGIEEFGDIITIATTNLIEKVEKAMKNRPGRFDRVIEIPLPDEECRKLMFVKFTENFILDNIDIDKLAKETDGLSGAYIKNICETAALLAIDRGRVDKDNKITIIETDFCDAISEINDKELSGCSDFKKNTGNAPPIGFKYKKN